MIDGRREITRRTFLEHVDEADYRRMEAALGYWPADRTARLTMAHDWSVRYYRGKLHGETVVWINHSAIEYVFKAA
jgi:hypothetical protein